MSFKELCHMLYGNENDASGYKEAEIRAWSKANKITMPEVLVSYLKQVGKMSFNQAHNRLYYLDQLTITDGKLIFMEENQQVVIWGCDLDQENPQVYQGHIEGDVVSQWYAEEERLDEFLQQMILFQTVMGGHDHSATIDYTAEIEECFITTWRPFTCSNQRLKFFFSENVLVMLLYYYSGMEIYLSSHRKDRLEQFETTSKLTLSWL